jgi:hypothetical protein
MVVNRIPYIAGLLDGEGGFSIVMTNKKPPRFQAHISLQHTHKETVSKFAKWCGVSPQSRLGPKGGRLYYTRINTQEDLKKLLEMLKPWLITKKKHAELILNFLSLTGELQSSTKRLDPSRERSIRSEQVDIFVNLRKLNPKDPQRRHVDYEKLREELHKELAWS